MGSERKGCRFGLPTCRHATKSEGIGTKALEQLGNNVELRVVTPQREGRVLAVDDN